MNILITNDDGWGAPGIQALLEIAGEFGDCTIVAPATEQSGVSHQQTMGREMQLIGRSANEWSLDGTPADCVRLAMLRPELFLSDSQFDLVFSGINNGGNMGSDIYVSGTVAAAREAALFGLPAIAISQHRLRFGEAFDWANSKTLARMTIQHCIENGLIGRQLININLPDVSGVNPLPTISIVDPCLLDPAPRQGSYETQGFEYGLIVRFSGNYNQRNQSPGCDVETCFAKNVSITRIDH